MVSKTLPMGVNCNATHILIFGGYVKMRKSFTPKLLYGSLPFYTILRLGRFNVGMKALAWCIDPNGFENKNTIKYSYPTDIKNFEIVVTVT